MYLNGKERGRTGMFKSANMKKAVQKGYREAMAMKALTDEEYTESSGLTTVCSRDAIVHDRIWELWRKTPS